MSSTEYVKRKGYKPIDFFFRAVVDAKSKKVPFVDAFQILNDRYLGRMNVMNYFFVAENSVRINELNVIALDELKNYHLVMRQNFYIPEKVVYSLPLTSRFLGSDRDLEILQATLRENGYKKGSLVLAFNANTLQALPIEAKIRYDRLRRMGFKTCVYGFGDEFNELDLFARYTFDYLRCEASYFDATPKKKALLTMLIKYCKANKMTLIMEGIDSPAQSARFKRAGVSLLTGRAVAKLSRWVTHDVLNQPALTTAQKEAYIKKLEQEEADRLRKEEAAKEKARIAAIEKARKDAADGKVVAPEAPKPDAMKSPYQVRLEKQRAAAKRAEEIREAKKAQKAELFDVRKEDKDTRAERKLYEDAAKFMGKDVNAFGGDDVFGMKLNLGRSAPKFKSKEAEVIVSEAEEYDIPSYDSERVLSEGKPLKEAFDEKKADAEDKAKKEAEAKAKEERIAAKLAAREAKAQEAAAEENDANVKTTEQIAETEKEELVTAEDIKAAASEIASESASAQAGADGNVGADTPESANSQAGAYTSESAQADASAQGTDEVASLTEQNSAEAEEDEPQGHYNDKGQWVDEDGNVYNGYWDENGDWVDYEEFDELEEGHYNDKGQWVAADGTVYNGYYDEQGRWIDYSYQNEDGEWVDNGYWDEKIGKWVPYGYFEDGVWHNF